MVQCRLFAAFVSLHGSFGMFLVVIVWYFHSWNEIHPGQVTNLSQG